MRKLEIVEAIFFTMFGLYLLWWVFSPYLRWAWKLTANTRKLEIIGTILFALLFGLWALLIESNLSIGAYNVHPLF
jgi:Kef-type K+ transport system membrane component KefB